jgi:Zn-dependent protease with chaperone function
VTPALLELGYGVAVAWLAPRALIRLTASGISARYGIAAWVTAMLTVLGAAAAAVQFLLRAAVAGWPALAQALCRSVAGNACTPTVYRSALFEFGLAVLASGVVLTAAILAWRFGRGVQLAQRNSRAHAAIAQVAGRRLAGSADTVVLDSERAAAYCVPGRPATIVLTSQAVRLLEPAQLRAVVAHERAHLSGRHHALILLTRGLSALFPGIPLFTAGQTEVARLAELSADDAAVRRAGRLSLVSALLALGTGSPVPSAALAATGGAVTARVARLLDPCSGRRQGGYRLALLAVTGWLAAAAGMVTVLAAHLG